MSSTSSVVSSIGSVPASSSSTSSVASYIGSASSSPPSPSSISVTFPPYLAIAVLSSLSLN